MKYAAASLAAATALTLTLSLCGTAQAAEKAHAAEPAHGAGVPHEVPEPPLLGPPHEAEFGQIGTGATKRGTAGGGTVSTNRTDIGSGSYGLRPAFARADIAEPGVPVTGLAFATAPAITRVVPGLEQPTTGSIVGGAGVTPAAFLPIPAGARGSAVRDHSFAASPNAPGPGGYYRPNSIPSTEIGPILPSYFASPEGRALPIEVPHHETNAPTEMDH